MSAGTFADLLAALQWQSTVAAALALGVALMLRRRWPRAARVLVLLALVKFLLPPTFAAPTALLGDLASALQPLGWDGGRWSAPIPPVAILTIWLGGAIVVIWRARRQSRALGRVIAAGAVVDRGPLQDLLARLCTRLGVVRTPRLVVADVGGPFAIGITRPTIVLPLAYGDGLDRRNLSAVLAHELIHHRRHDLAGLWLAHLVVAAAWFNPAAWLLRARLRALQEDCCDDEVLESRVTGVDEYVSALLSSARLTTMAPAAGMGSRPHPLRRRIVRLLSRQRPPGPQRMAVLAAAVIFGTIALPSAGIAAARQFQRHEVVRIVIHEGTTIKVVSDIVIR